jgi:hypothetical protein
MLPQRGANLSTQRTVIIEPRRGRWPIAVHVDVIGRNEQPLKTASYASDPAWSPLQPGF